MPRTTLGLIGLGQIGQVHLYNALHMRNARIKSVADVSKRSLRTAAKFGIRHLYTSYEDLLKDPEIDAVIISLPPYIHRRCVESAAEAGKDIFLEKPLAQSLREGEQILSCVTSHNVRMMIGYHLRFHTPFQDLKKMIDEGRLGDVIIAQALCIGPGPFFERGNPNEGRPQPVPDWWFDRKSSGGGALLDQGCHLVNLLRWYFGEVKSVKCFIGHRFDMDLEDHAICFLRFESDTKAVVSVGWFSCGRPLTEIALGGTADSTSASLTEPSPKEFIMRNIRRRIKGKPLLPLNYGTYYDELEHFIDCLNSDFSPSISANDALADLRTIFAAYENTAEIDNHVLSENQHFA